MGAVTSRSQSPRIVRVPPDHAEPPGHIEPPGHDVPGRRCRVCRHYRVTMSAVVALSCALSSVAASWGLRPCIFSRRMVVHVPPGHNMLSDHDKSRVQNAECRCRIKDKNTHFILKKGPLGYLAFPFLAVTNVSKQPRLQQKTCEGLRLTERNSTVSGSKFLLQSFWLLDDVIIFEDRFHSSTGYNIKKIRTGCINTER